MPASIHFASLQVCSDVNSGLDSIVHDTCDAFVKLSWDPMYIEVSVDASKAFNNTSKPEILRQTASHSPSFIRFANVLYAKEKPYLCFCEDWLRS